ncbi:MAG: DnaB-like helicase C-terminal domain-containing protein, partial [Rikenellaceae bacterium]|nr:DnaB-like helicase C-terminal domain-containing protein [Rikenellaceae bacterium]
LKAIYDIDVIIIDYLQLMTGANETKGNREQEVASISRALKAIAKELNVPIMALSQLNRGLQARNDKRPQLSDLRESGSIEQDADIVAFIHRPEYYGLREDENQNSTDGLAEIIFAKHRNGATDTVKMRFQKHLAKFSDWDGGSIDSILMQGGDISSNGRVKIIESSMNSDGFEESPF